MKGSYLRRQESRSLARTLAAQRAHPHRSGTLQAMATGYWRLECDECLATIALYSWRKRAGSWELDLVYHCDGSVGSLAGGKE